MEGGGATLMLVVRLALDVGVGAEGVCCLLAANFALRAASRAATSSAAAGVVVLVVVVVAGADVVVGCTAIGWGGRSLLMPDSSRPSSSSCGCQCSGCTGRDCVRVRKGSRC